MKFFTPLAVILVCVGMYFLYISPVSMEVKALVQKKTELDDVLQKVKDLTQKREEVSGAYNSISQADIDKLNKVIPERFDSVAFANDISTVATQNSLTFKDYKISDSVPESQESSVEQKGVTPFRVSIVSFKVTGQYADFLRFLNKIETSLRLMDVIGLKVEQDPKQDKNSTATMQYTLEISTYSLK
ncbi:MAG: putative pilO [Parcubacteria bacterium C7867-006]|nr:MAG: putative pilO [Parcubacteria bacterium C7867-006]